MDFGDAIRKLKEGDRVGRRGWNGKGMYLILVMPYHNNQFKVIELEGIEGTLLPYIAMKTADGGLVPWLASQTDMLGDDWELVTL